MKRGEIWLVSLDPTLGSEIQKTRPCLIVSPDDLNSSLMTLIVAPLTTGSRRARFRIATKFRGKEGLILTDQIRTVSRQRLVKRLGSLPPATLDAVLQVLREAYER